jgi:hypothetical protein
VQVCSINAETAAARCREAFDGWVKAVKRRHPFVGGKPDRRQLALEAAGPRGLARSEVAVDQMHARHSGLAKDLRIDATDAAPLALYSIPHLE